MIEHPPDEHILTNILKVSAKSNPNAVAGALAAVMRDREQAELQAVGAGAINQAVKAIAIARAYLKGSHVDLVCVPSFIDVAIEGTSRTGISLHVAKSHPEGSTGGESAASPSANA
ncbi:MAG: stage V sporulation protein S [Candidatus Eremiobacteraeota bacterium]|nr:stage V sporulation protein S [Candidatus Eremiobacteraeota bacterium]